MTELRILKLKDGNFAALSGDQISYSMCDDECLGLVSRFVQDRPLRWMQNIPDQIARIEAGRHATTVKEGLEAFGLMPVVKVDPTPEEAFCSLARSAKAFVESCGVAIKAIEAERLPDDRFNLTVTKLLRDTVSAMQDTIYSVIGQRVEAKS